MGQLTGKIEYTILKSCLGLQSYSFHCTVTGALLFSFFFVTLSFAQAEQEPEEILIYIKGRNIGGKEVPAYLQGQVVFLPVTDLFSFLKIQNTPSPGFDTVSGFFINPLSPYLIDRVKNQIHYQLKVYQLNPGDLIQTENNLYLKSDYFGQVFGLDCIFDYRSFSVFLKTTLDLPVIREMRQELMRNNISRLKGDMKTDTNIRRNYPFFHFGSADWSISATQVLKSVNNVRLNLALGGLFAGGEATINLNYSNNLPFIEKQQYWLWHFANNDLRALKQVMVGKILPHATSSIGASVVGVQVTNTPTTFNRSFGTYTINDYTKPGWIVELFVNYVLVDYVKADASGYFSFEVPLVYGNSLIKLRFYGPWGEEHSQEQTINIPFNFLPPKKLEYMVSGGFVEDSQNSRFSRVDFHYGVSSRLTVGSGVEYLSSVTSGNTMPFVNFSLRLASSMLVSGEYIYGVRLRGVMSYRLRSNLLFELFYTSMNKDQQAITNKYLEERKVVISKPVRFRYFPALLRFTLYQLIVPQSNYYSSEFMISGSFLGVSTNLTTIALFSDPVHPYIFSDLSLGFRLPAKFIVTPQVQYLYSQNRFLTFKIGVEKQLFRNGILNLSYDRNFFLNTDNFQIGLRYDLPYAQTNVSARNANNTTSLMQFAKGSLMYEGKEGKFGVNNYSSLGKGGIIILPFLDLNGNGQREKDEPRVAGLDLRITGGRIEKNKHDSTIRISDLEPYTKYFIELDRNSFDNISWRIPKATIGITINPNQYKLVEVPVTVVGEVSGFVLLREDSLQRGLGRIYIDFYRKDSSFVTRTLSESDGYFSYFGLSPGAYTARIDKTQLQKVKMKASPEVVSFTILKNREGGQAGGLEFVLLPIQSDTSGNQTNNENTVVPVPEEKVNPVQEQKPATVPEKPLPPAPEQKTVPVPENKEIPLQEEKTVLPATVQQSGNVLINADSSRYHIQVGAFRVQANAMTVQTKLSAILGRPVIIIQENGYYKLRITGFTRYTTASTFLQKVFRQGFPDAFIHKNR